MRIMCGSLTCRLQSFVKARRVVEAVVGATRARRDARDPPHGARRLELLERSCGLTLTAEPGSWATQKEEDIVVVVVVVVFFLCHAKKSKIWIVSFVRKTCANNREPSSVKERKGATYFGRNVWAVADRCCAARVCVLRCACLSLHVHPAPTHITKTFFETTDVWLFDDWCRCQKMVGPDSLGGQLCTERARELRKGAKSPNGGSLIQSGSRSDESSSLTRTKTPLPGIVIPWSYVPGRNEIFKTRTY